MRRVRLISIVLATALFFGQPLHSFAQSTVIEDDFSSDLSKWQPVRDDGRYWHIADQELEVYLPFASTITELVPKDAFWNATAKNLELSMKYLPVLGGDKNISFGYIDSKNWYELHFTNTFTEIVKVSNGATAWVSQTGAVLPNGVNYNLKLQFINGTINFFANGQQLFSVVDPTYIGEFGKIGLKASTGSIYPTKIIFDDILVKTMEIVGDVSLHIPLLKQTDPQWANEEYDTASHWLAVNSAVSPNFKDWACNLISQLMLLRYFGINTLPDGTDLTPQSFNQWLLANNGYLNSPYTGNINRLSISKLSTLVSESLGTPKLEYKYVSENIIPKAIEEIDKGNPVILQLDGHFVIADGYTQDKTDLLIKDPSFNVKKLSEHPRKLLSMRLYSPSHTDLSYLSVQYDPEIEVTFPDEIKNQVVTYDEYLRAEETENKKVRVSEIAKPSDSEVPVSIIAHNPGYLEITAITTDGTTQTLFKDTSLEVGSHQVKIEYKKDEASEIEIHDTQEESEQEYSWSEFRQLVTSMYKEKQIKRVQFKNVVLKLARTSERLAEHHRKAKIKAVLKILIKTAPRIFITTDAKNQLIAALEKLTD